MDRVKCHIEITSTGGQFTMVTRKVNNIRDAIELAFEEACTEPKRLSFIEITKFEE